ncbi:ABC transporter substrate-binding protein [Breznakiella homolactica]|uniref:Cobalamin-binding protein n=1 Tax=Breznakiella homolactica TaxID=2798577 RepID=A0A7T8B7F8_9SPIR|nr:cobalamin-binding protein [Breznakiella homolactica]QQO07474.1 cobalamin-binding protein [Breznakiella homolactica]
MNRRCLRALLPISILLFVSPALPGQAYPHTFTDVLGRTVTMEAPARRVVSLSPAVTEILFSIGAGDSTIGVTEFCDYPPEALQKTKVGGFSGATVSIEQIAALKPDLVILSGFMHTRVITLLEGIGIRCFAVEPEDFDGIFDTIKTIGLLTGTHAGADRTIAGMREKLAQAEEIRRGKPTVPVYWELWDDPVISTGGGTFVSQAISRAGGRNIFDDLTEMWPQVSGEQVLIRRPAWILLSDAHGAAADPLKIRQRPGWASVPAVAGGNISVVSDDILLRSGPRLADAVLEIARIIHGK